VQLLNDVVVDLGKVVCDSVMEWKHGGSYPL